MSTCAVIGTNTLVQDCETLKNIFQNVVGWRIWNATWVMSFQAMFVLFFCANELFGVTEG